MGEYAHLRRTRRQACCCDTGDTIANEVIWVALSPGENRVLGVQESGIGGAESYLGGGLGPADEQVVRIETARQAYTTGMALVVTVTGEIDLLTIDRLRAVVAAGFEDLRGGEMFVIDLTPVTFMDSRGLQALVDATQAAAQRREPLRIVVDHTRPVIRPIQVTGLDNVLALFETVEDAVHAPL
jgi:anti-sigma B factor antagonist